MPKARSIRVGVIDSDRVNSIDEPSQNLFFRLMMIADDYGHYDGRTAMIRSGCYPTVDIRLDEINRRLKACAEVNLIEFYIADDKPYVEILRFGQRLQQMRPKYPMRPESTVDHGESQQNSGGSREKPSTSSSTSSSTSDSDSDQIKAFDVFWQAYPKKRGKLAASRAFDKLKEPKTTLALILAALEWQRTQHDWVKDNGDYIPMPATYLNQGRWMDERPAKRKNESVWREAKSECGMIKKEGNAKFRCFLNAGHNGPHEWTELGSGQDFRKFKPSPHRTSEPASVGDIIGGMNANN